MNKSDLIIAITGAMEIEPRTIEMRSLGSIWFDGTGEAVPNSAESKHLKNNGEPWKRRNKRGFK